MQTPNIPQQAPFSQPNQAQGYPGNFAQQMTPMAQQGVYSMPYPSYYQYAAYVPMGKQPMSMQTSSAVPVVVHTGASMQSQPQQTTSDSGAANYVTVPHVEELISEAVKKAVSAEVGGLLTKLRNDQMAGFKAWLEQGKALGYVSDIIAEEIQLEQLRSMRETSQVSRTSSRAASDAPPGQSKRQAQPSTEMKHSQSRTKVSGTSGAEKKETYSSQAAVETATLASDKAKSLINIKKMCKLPGCNIYLVGDQPFCCSAHEKEFQQLNKSNKGHNN